MNVLVTGGNGFIGRAVVQRLLEGGHKPVVYDRHHLSMQETWVGDIRDTTAVHDAMAHVDAFIHLAGVLGTQETILNPRPAAETNMLGGLNVLEAAAAYRLPGVNIAVGNHWMPNTYSITKNTVERFVDMFNLYRGTRISSVRVFNAYGPSQSIPVPYGPSQVRKIIPSFIHRALDGQPIQVYGDGSQVMDMIHVRDAAEALVRALEETAVAGPLAGLEAGSGVPTTVREIASLVARTVADETGRERVGVELLPMRPGEPPASWVCAEHHHETAAALGLPPLIPLEDGLVETVRWYTA